MGSLLNPTIDRFLRTRRVKSRNKHTNTVRRTIIPIGKQITVDIHPSDKLSSDESRIQKMHLNGDRTIINLKASLYLRQKMSRLGSMIARPSEKIGEKAGIVNASSTLGRAVQGVGSYLTPGNISPARNPLRSGLYRAITPGGGGGIRRIIPNVNDGISRCPAGFEFGGRFTNNQFSTCGAQLFDIPGPLALIARGVRRLNNRPPTARAESLAQVVEGQASSERTLQIQRLAKIPRNAAPNRPAFNKAVLDSIKILKGAEDGEGRMIRRDGIILRPIVPSSVLRQFSGNPDMLDGAMIRAARTPQSISSDDLGLLAGPSMSRISFVAPNGASINIERQRALTVGERRKFGRQLNSAVNKDPYDVGANIRLFAEGSNGAFKYTEEFGNVPKPLELVTFTGDDGVERTVRRWVYEAFIKNTAKKAKK